jgi:hypothetical protein
VVTRNEKKHETRANAERFQIFPQSKQEVTFVKANRMRNMDAIKKESIERSDSFDFWHFFFVFQCFAELHECLALSLAHTKRMACRCIQRASSAQRVTPVSTIYSR